jgi:hypothetical protein
MRIITMKWLEDNDACEDGRTWFEEHFGYRAYALDVAKTLLAEKEDNWFWWLFAKDDRTAIEMFEGGLVNGDMRTPCGCGLLGYELSVDLRPARIKLLLKLGADPNVPNCQGSTPLELACDSPEITALLKKAGAKENE